MKYFVRNKIVLSNNDNFYLELVEVLVVDGFGITSRSDGFGVGLHIGTTYLDFSIHPEV